MASADDIFNAAQSQIKALQDVDSAIDTKVAAIKNSSPGVPLAPSQIKTMTALRQQQSTVLSAMDELAYVTMAALDDSSEMKKLTISLAAVVTNLQASTAAISAIGGAATNIGNIATAVSGITSQVKSLAAD